MLRQDHMLQDSVLVHNLVNKVTRRHLDREGDRRLVTRADHPDGGGALDHLDLLPQLETDGLTLVDMEVDRVLTGPVLSGCGATLTHCHRHPWRMLSCVLSRVGARQVLAGLLTVAHRLEGGGLVRIFLVLIVLQSGREGADSPTGGHVVRLTAVAGV